LAGDKWIALRVAYIGWNYYGAVRQPGLPTIEGSLVEALSDQGIEAKLKFTSRTDRGVSALDNVVTYRGTRPNISRLNATLPKDIAVWGLIESDSRVKAIEKTYLYVVPLELDIERLLENLREASLSPDLCKEGEAPRPSCDARAYRGLTLVLVTGKSFCWQMVRRLVGRAVGPMIGKRMDVAPAEGLTLLKTEVDRQWDELYTYKLQFILKELEKGMWRWGTGLLLLDMIRWVISSGRLPSWSRGRTT